MEISDSLRRFRTARGLSLAKVGAPLGKSRQNWFLYEKGIATPPADVIVNTAVAYGVSTDYLLGLTDDPRPRPMLNEAAADETAAPEQTSVVTAPAAGMSVEELAARVARLEARLDAARAAGIEI